MTDRFTYTVARDEDDELGVFAARIVSEDNKYWRLHLDDRETAMAFGLAERRSKDRETYFSPREALLRYLAGKQSCLRDAAQFTSIEPEQVERDIADAEELLKEFPK